MSAGQGDLYFNSRAFVWSPLFSASSPPGHLVPLPSQSEPSGGLPRPPVPVPPQDFNPSFFCSSNSPQIDAGVLVGLGSPPARRTPTPARPLSTPVPRALSGLWLAGSVVPVEGNFFCQLTPAATGPAITGNSTCPTVSVSLTSRLLCSLPSGPNFS